MKQCEIWYADLNPTRGSEQQGFRPVVIISGNLLNQYLPIVITCPLTTKIKTYKGKLGIGPKRTKRAKTKIGNYDLSHSFYLKGTFGKKDRKHHN
ncbi:MAG TPA: type II toxin-antitoxin system PemK/MazF family toxin [Sunxiuqinia sp.]|nr:type II toxin-antitoxin system PemK/MazF family toxin [Sunxiuqinia sp.]